MSVESDLYPRLSRAARLRFDQQERSYVLLSPERGLRLNESAAAVLERCTGEHTVPEIVRSLLDATASPPSTQIAMAEDVLSLLLELEHRQLVVFGPRA
jgi:pyrroloquinoline quinone biosynthesis protein D